MTHRFLSAVLAPKSAIPQAPQALLGLSRRPIKTHSPNSSQTTETILLQQAENKADRSLGPFLISGCPVIFPREHTSELLQVGLFWSVLFADLVVVAGGCPLLMPEEIAIGTPPSTPFRDVKAHIYMHLYRALPRPPTTAR